jgi:hypothetical protein
MGVLKKDSFINILLFTIKAFNFTLFNKAIVIEEYRPSKDSEKRNRLLS